MSLFMVLIVAGKIAGSWGPLPYDMKECLSRQLEFQEALRGHEASKDWRVACRELERRPELGDSAGADEGAGDVDEEDDDAPLTPDDVVTEPEIIIDRVSHRLRN